MRDVYSVPVTGGATSQLSPQIKYGEGFVLPLVSADGDTMILPIRRTTGGNELYRTSVSAGDPVLFDRADSLTEAAFGGPLARIVDPGGVLCVVYAGERDGATGLYAREIRGEQTSTVSLSGPLVAGGEISSLVITSDQSRALYIADQDQDGTNELYAVRLGHRCRGRYATHTGTSDDDTISGTAGDDVIVTLGGADTVKGRGGNDLICTAGGDDTVSGGPGDDTVLAGKGNDTATGGRGNDRLLGQRGDDNLNGGPGDDTCRGGPGTNSLTSC